MQKKFLIIQNAFTGDVILATAIIEKLALQYRDSRIDFLLRKGNEGLLKNHPYVSNVLIWEKSKNKYSNLLSLLKQIRKTKYDTVINIHRFGSSGFLTAFSNAKTTIGFDKNPFSVFYSKKIKHEIGNGKHEVERNQELIESITDNSPASPALYPTQQDFEKAVAIASGEEYICIAPASVWFTKQYPINKWIEFLNAVKPSNIKLLFLGGTADMKYAEEIIKGAEYTNAVNLCGKLSFLESAALIKNAKMNYVNDSAPLHMASAMKANVCVIYCSTVPAFGFGPLHNNSFVIQSSVHLPCKPCGLHGFRSCPEKHFNCAQTINTNELLVF